MIVVTGFFFIFSMVFEFIKYYNKPYIAGFDSRKTSRFIYFIIFIMEDKHRYRDGGVSPEVDTFYFNIYLTRYKTKTCFYIIFNGRLGEEKI